MSMTFTVASTKFSGNLSLYSLNFPDSKRDTAELDVVKANLFTISVLILSHTFPLQPLFCSSKHPQNPPNCFSAFSGYSYRISVTFVHYSSLFIHSHDEVVNIGFSVNCNWLYRMSTCGINLLKTAGSQNMNLLSFRT